MKVVLKNGIEINNCDCLDLLGKLPECSIDTIIADPPYFLGLTHNGVKGTFTDLAICRPFYRELFTEFKRVLKPAGCVYFFCDWRGFAFYFPIFLESLKADNMLVWEKHGRPTPNIYGFAHELIIFHGKIKKSYVSNVITDIKNFNSGCLKSNGGVKLHPTQKPIELVEQFILDSTDSGAVVLDPFMGSGTTAIACINTEREFIGADIDIKYFDIAKKSY